MLDKLNFLSGKVTYNDFYIDPDLPFNDQIYNYKEDLLQIEYGEHYLVDVGWYPEFDPDGFLIIRVVKDYDWENLILEKRIKAKDITSLPEQLNEVIQFVDQIENHE